MGDLSPEERAERAFVGFSRKAVEEFEKSRKEGMNPRDSFAQAFALAFPTYVGAGAAEIRAAEEAAEARYMGDNNREDMEARRIAAAIRARAKGREQSERGKQ